MATGIGRAGQMELSTGPTIGTNCVRLNDLVGIVSPKEFNIFTGGSDSSTTQVGKLFQTVVINAVGPGPYTFILNMRDDNRNTGERLSVSIRPDATAGLIFEMLDTLTATTVDTKTSDGSGDHIYIEYIFDEISGWIKTFEIVSTP